jgi:hypothetical protein
MRSRVNTESLDKLHEDDIVVEHAEFGVGSILDKNDTHAEVMFAEGVEVVKIDTLTVIDEARGRPPKNDDDPDGEANRNIVTQLHKVNNGTATHVKFNDGGKHPITASHARMAIEKHGSYEKPVDKASFQEKLGASHDSFKSSIGA